MYPANTEAVSKHKLIITEATIFNPHHFALNCSENVSYMRINYNIQNMALSALKFFNSNERGT
jgi:hypothetical protein